MVFTQPLWLPPVLALVACFISGLTLFGDAIMFLLMWSVCGQFGLFDDSDADALPRAVAFMNFMPIANLPVFVWVARRELRPAFAWATVLTTVIVGFSQLGLYLLLFGGTYAIRVVCGTLFVSFGAIRLALSCRKRPSSQPSPPTSVSVHSDGGNGSGDALQREPAAYWLDPAVELPTRVQPRDDEVEFDTSPSDRVIMLQAMEHGAGGDVGNVGSATGGGSGGVLVNGVAVTHDVTTVSPARDASGAGAARDCTTIAPRQQYSNPDDATVSGGGVLSQRSGAAVAPLGEGGPLPQGVLEIADPSGGSSGHRARSSLSVTPTPPLQMHGTVERCRRRCSRYLLAAFVPLSDDVTRVRTLVVLLVGGAASGVIGGTRVGGSTRTRTRSHTQHVCRRGSRLRSLGDALVARPSGGPCALAEPTPRG